MKRQILPSRLHQVALVSYLPQTSFLNHVPSETRRAPRLPAMATPTPATPSNPSGTATATPTCITAVPDKYGQVPVDACNSQWPFHPAFGPNLAWAVLMGLTTAVHLLQAVLYRKVRRRSASCLSVGVAGVDYGLYRNIAGFFLWGPRGRRRRLRCALPARGISSRRRTSSSARFSVSWRPCVSQPQNHHTRRIKVSRGGNGCFDN